jgi:hypothetical protein
MSILRAHSPSMQLTILCAIATLGGPSCVAAGDDVSRGPLQEIQQNRGVEGSPCPDLGGTYSEEGNTFQDGGQTRAISHLSWLIGAKEVSALTPLSTWPSAGKPAVYFVRRIRVSHPAAGRFALEAIDVNGKNMGIFEFGVEDGWRCEGGAFVNSRKSEGGGEGTWGDTEGLHKLYRGPGGVLVRYIFSRYQQRTAFLLGGPVGSPKVINVEYHFPLASQ